MTDEEVRLIFDELRRIGADLVGMSDRMDGPLPPKIEAFVREYGALDA